MMVIATSPGTFPRGNVGGGSGIEADMPVRLYRTRCPLLSAVLDGIDLVEEELAQSVRTIPGLGKAESWIRTYAVVARTVAKAVAEDPLLGAAGGNAQMEATAIAIQTRLFEGVDL